MTYETLLKLQDRYKKKADYYSDLTVFGKRSLRPYWEAQQKKYNRLFIIVTEQIIEFERSRHDR